MLATTRAATHRADDEEIAGRCTATLLITGSTAEEVERIARSIHFASARGSAPFVLVYPGCLPIEPSVFRAQWSTFVEAATGGSLLMIDVDTLAVPVQEVLIEVLADLQSANPVIRLMAGTTVSLLDRIAVGTFSERLFYRLNLLHLM